LRRTSTPRSATGAGVPSKAAGLLRKVLTTAIDWSYTLRPINIEHIERLGGATRLPPISVWEFQPGRYRGIDGYHRWRLAKHRGEPLVEATLHRYPQGPAGEQAFEFEAVRSNLQHGLPLSRDERNRAIARLWSRWGRGEGRPGGYTMDDIGRLFNLTKQRVHQILIAQQAAETWVPDPVQAGGGETSRNRSAEPPAQAARMPASGRVGTPGRFSTFGRFSAATRRMRNLLRDDPFMAALWRQHRVEALAQLRELQGLIDNALAGRR
jgi:hypothetical protein